MTGKKRRKDDPDSDSDSTLAAEFASPMDSDSPAVDPRSSLTSDPGSRPTTAPGNDPRSSRDLARSTDPRVNLANAPDQPTTANSTDDPSASSASEQFLSPCGSYLVVKPCDDGVSFRKINVFWPQKQIAAICGSAAEVGIEAPANGTLLLKTNSRVHTKALLKVTTFCGKKVTVSLHQGRNSSKGTIFAPELRHMTEEEILSDLRGDGVTHIRRLTTFKDGQRRDTSLLVLTFNSTSLPEKINIGWLRKDVRVFIPNPLRCFKCHRFGHGSSTCRQSARCQRCGETPHDGSECSAPTLCLSCGSSDHLVSSSQCPVWKEEKAVCELKAKSGLSYPEARRQVKATTATPTPGKTYAQATKIQTITAETQTDPLPQLPPLKLLPPRTSETVISTQTPAESVTPAAAPTHPTPQLTSDTPCPGATTRSGAWQVVGGRGKVRPPGTGQPAPSLPRPLSPARGRPERQPRPAIRVAPGRCRSSHSVGRFPSGGGNSSFA